MTAAVQAFALLQWIESRDLSLLLTLDALRQEGSVTLAARRLGLSTPAASHASLESAHASPIRCWAGRSMTLTPRAEELQPLVRSFGNMHRHPDLIHEDVDRGVWSDTRYSIAMGPIAYALGTGLAWVSQIAPFVRYRALALYFVFPHSVRSRPLGQRTDPE